jgi:hypothetical protein
VPQPVAQLEDTEFLSMKYSALLKHIWNALYNPDADVKQIVEKYFHPDYQQCINGVVLNRSEYIDHVIAQKQQVSIDSFHYEHILENERELFALYFPKGKNVSGDTIEAEVIAYFVFKDEQILKIHGQVRILEGNSSDVDM